MKNLLVALLLSLSISCSFAPKEELHSLRPSLFPDFHLFDTTYVVKSGDSWPIEIVAGEIELYQEDEKAYLTDAHFSQRDEEGNLLFSGTFEMGIVDTESDDVELRGDVFIKNHQENLTIEAPILYWDNADWRVHSDDNIVVTLTRDGHDILKGVGFFADFKRSLYEFAEVTEGVLHYE